MHRGRWTSRALASQLLTEQARLEDLVDDLIHTARFDEQGTHAGDIAVEIDLDDIVMEECLRLRSVTSVRVDTSQVSAAKVWGDPSDLRRLVRNLLSNASRHARSEVTVALEVVDTTAVLVVDDDGPGIELEDRDAVFERFVRLDEARARDSGGVGLGLAIVHRIVTDHGGTIGVSESPRGGAQFTVRLRSSG